MSKEIFDVDKFGIHTADAYYGNVKGYMNNIVIPYINLALFDYEKSRFDRVANFIDYGYLVLLDVTKSTMIQFKIEESEDSCVNSLVLGGVCIDKSPFEDTEFTVKSRKAYFQLTSVSRISKNEINGIDFIPVDTPAFRPTLDQQTTKRFLNYEFLNPDIKQLLSIA